MAQVRSIVRDIGTACSYFRRNRGFFAVAVVNLELGIGATTAVFSVAETLLLRLLPYPASDRLVTLRSVDTISDDPTTRVAPGILADWKPKATSFEAIAGHRRATAELIGGAQCDRLNGLLATPEFFDLFGAPLPGCTFQTADRGAQRPLEPTAPGHTLMFGNAVWRRRFDADAALVGRTVHAIRPQFPPRRSHQVHRCRHRYGAGPVSSPRSRFPDQGFQLHRNG